MFGVAAAAAVGWLILFVLLLAAPPPPRRHVTGSGPGQAAAGDEPPAVVSLLARQLGTYGFEATLVDLAARRRLRRLSVTGNALQRQRDQRGVLPRLPGRAAAPAGLNFPLRLALRLATSPCRGGY